MIASKKYEQQRKISHSARTSNSACNCQQNAANTAYWLINVYRRFYVPLLAYANAKTWIFCSTCFLLATSVKAASAVSLH
jgi:hypothetical protein